MREGIGHTLDLGSALLRQLRRGVEVQVVGDRAGYLQPAEERFRIAGLHRNVARRRRGGGRLRLRLFVLAPIDLFVGRHILQDAVVAAVDHIDTPFFVDGDPVGKIQLAFRFAAVAPGAEEGAVAVELLDPVIAGVHNINVPQRVAGDAPRRFELSGPRALPPPLR